MIAVISHSQLTFDQIGYALGGPQLGPISMGHGPLRQETNKLSFLFQGQSGRPSWRGLGFQGLLSARVEGIAPPHNATRMATDASGNLVKRQFQLQERNHTAPTLFQPFGRSFRSHRDTPI